MSRISDTLRVTLLSLKQISDRVKSLITTSVTKSEANSAKQEVLTAISDIDIDTSDLAKQGSNANATLTATQAALIDGNDTAISVSKEIRSEVGTGSDTAAEIGTLFAVVKWVKDKVKSIDALIGYTISEIDGV